MSSVFETFPLVCIWHEENDPSDLCFLGYRPLCTGIPSVSAALADHTRPQFKWSRNPTAYVASIGKSARQQFPLSHHVAHLDAAASPAFPSTLSVMPIFPPPLWLALASTTRLNLTGQQILAGRCKSTWFTSHIWFIQQRSPVLPRGR